MWQTLSTEHKLGATVAISASLLETRYYLSFLSVNESSDLLLLWAQWTVTTWLSTSWSFHESLSLWLLKFRHKGLILMKRKSLSCRMLLKQTSMAVAVHVLLQHLFLYQMNHSFFFCTWWPVVDRTTAESGSSADSAPLSSWVKYSPLWRAKYRPIKTAIITSAKKMMARIPEKL